MSGTQPKISIVIPILFAMLIGFGILAAGLSARFADAIVEGIINAVFVGHAERGE